MLYNVKSSLQNSSQLLQNMIGTENAAFYLRLVEGVHKVSLQVKNIFKKFVLCTYLVVTKDFNHTAFVHLRYPVDKRGTMAPLQGNYCLLKQN